MNQSPNEQRIDFLNQCVVNNPNLPFIDNTNLAHYWSGLHEDEILTIVKQKLALKREGMESNTSFEEKLKELLTHASFQDGYKTGERRKRTRYMDYDLVGKQTSIY